MSDKKNGSITLMTGGDIGPVYEPTEEFAELIAPLLKQADIRLGQCERTYSERGEIPHYAYGPGGQHSRLHPNMAGVWNAAGIDVVSLASNHAMDWGPEALLDSIDLFRSMGKIVIGAGRDGDEARKPAIIEKNGVKVALLAYCSVVIDGYEAGPNKPGLAPLRAHSSFETADYQAGMPPRRTPRMPA